MGQSKMDNPEKLEKQGTQDTERRRIHVNLKVSPNKRQRIPKGQSKMDHQEKLVTKSTLDTERRRIHVNLNLKVSPNKLQRIPKGQSKMDNPEKLAAQGSAIIISGGTIFINRNNSVIAW